MPTELIKRQTNVLEAHNIKSISPTNRGMMRIQMHDNVIWYTSSPMIVEMRTYNGTIVTEFKGDFTK